MALFISSSPEKKTKIAYTGYRRSIDGVLEAGNGSVVNNKSNSNEAQSNVDVENHTLKSTATIITQNTSSHDQTLPSNQQSATSSETFIQNEQQAQVPPPKPAPRTRLSSQNSIPMTNGDGVKADDAAQVRALLLIVPSFIWLPGLALCH